MNFEVFGNSHAGLLSGGPPHGNKVLKQGKKPGGRGFTDINPDYPFRTWFLGPVLAYNFYEHHLSKVYSLINDHSTLFDKNSFILMFVGEIDCRVHLPKNVSKDRTYQNVVEECVNRYHRSIIDLKINFKNVGVIGSLPSMCDESIKKLMPLDEQTYNVSGTSALRNKISKHWDDFHRSLCAAQQIPYISIYENLVDENGKTKENLFSDFIHLSYDKTIDFWIKSFKEAGLL